MKKVVPVLNSLQTKSLNFVALLAVLALVACSTDEKAYVDRSVGDIYNGAMDKLEEGEYTEAAKEFDEVERQHPYSKWATKAQIMMAFAHYKGQKYDQVIASLESFSALHPAHPDVPYALYMTGLCYYEQIGPSLRDQQDTEDALRTFNELVRRFPNTDYAVDAKQKIIFLKDALAGKHMDIGRYYLDKKAYQAALPRFQEVSARYQTTKHVEEAHYRMVECYEGMGLQDQARQAAVVLGHNYPGSDWYAEAYELVGAADVPSFTQAAPTSEGVAGVDGSDETVMDRLRNWNKGPLKKKKSPISAPADDAPLDINPPEERVVKPAVASVESMDDRMKEYM